MKQFLSRMSGRLKAVVAVVAALLIVAIPAISFAGFGPDRPTKAYSQGVEGFDKPTFNSFAGVPNVGDERKFFTGQYPGENVWTDPLAEVENGDTLTLRVYVHNGADPSLNASGAGVATNTRVKVELPTSIAKTQQAKATISADNAQSVYDTLDFGAKNGGSFQLEYLPGSAHIKGNYIDSALSDSVVSGGAVIGSDQLNGKVKGCFDQTVIVTLKVKVKMPQYSIDKQVRHVGQTSADWKESTTAKAGDKTQWLITFKNTGTSPLKNVTIVDQVPAGLTVDPNSLKLLIGNETITSFAGTPIQDNGRTVHVKVNATLNPGILFYLMLDTKVDTPAANACGVKTLVNKAYGTPEGLGAIWEDAKVNVDTKKTCEPPVEPEKPAYKCDSLTVVKTGNGREVKADVKYTATNGAKLKQITYTFGDGKTLTTDKTSVNYTYAKDGTYNVVAKLLIEVDGTTKTVTSPSCEKPVTFSTPPVVPPETPENPEVPESPEELPITGPADVAMIVAGVSVISALGYRFFLGRRG